MNLGRAILQTGRRKGDDLRATSDLASAGQAEAFRNRVAERLVLRTALDRRMRRISRNAIDVLAKRVGGTVTHADATARLQELADAAPACARTAARAQVLPILGRLSAAVGLHVGSLALMRAGYRQLDDAVGTSRGRNAALDAVRVAVHLGDRELAWHRWSVLHEQIQGHDCDARAAVVGNFVAVWNRRPLPWPIDTTDPAEAAWQHALAGRRVLVYGPAPTPATRNDVPDDALIVRRIVPEQKTWSDPDDLAPGRADVLYLNGHTSTWLSTLPDAQRRELLAEVRFVVARRKADTISGTYVRPPVRCNPLLLRGAPHLVQNIVVDLLHVPDVHITVFGANFFVSAQLYRQAFTPVESVEMPAHLTADAGRFAFSSAHARQNFLENRRLLTHLVAESLVTGDADFLRAASLTDDAYAGELDKIYGVTER